jgi:hypothetical protein
MRSASFAIVLLSLLEDSRIICPANRNLYHQTSPRVSRETWRARILDKSHQRRQREKASEHSVSGSISLLILVRRITKHAATLKGGRLISNGLGIGINVYRLSSTPIPNESILIRSMCCFSPVIEAYLREIAIAPPGGLCVPEPEASGPETTISCAPFGDNRNPRRD